MGTVIFKHYYTGGTSKNIRLGNVLYMPNASGHFYFTGVVTQKRCKACET